MAECLTRLARSRTCYRLTNERVIIISGLFSRTVQSLQVQTLTDLSLSEEASGSGTITFGPTIVYSGRGLRASRSSQPSFESVADAREVFERICSARKAE
ncbi:MAG: PH domain-containing protein [Proteobacteria bacterium]|nr:PH domain-containing protein [Pseudomonadota bacterium]